jgi:hypothetical protein
VTLRYAFGILFVAALVVFGVEPLAATSSPLLATMSEANRSDLYSQVIVVSAGLLGFLITAVSILVSLDGKRKIVEELKRGESFRLLVANMLAAVALMFALTLMGIAGSALETENGASHAFARLYEWLLVASVAELVLSGFYFAVLTYKVAAHGD